MFIIRKINGSKPNICLQKFSTLHMHGMIYISTSTGLPCSGININGDLKIIQKQPLAHKGYDARFSVPIFNKTTIFPEAFNFKRIIHDYSERNVSMKLANEYFMWERGATGLGSPFEVKLRM